jgi:hypothetical protein
VNERGRAIAREVVELRVMEASIVSDFQGDTYEVRVRVGSFSTEIFVIRVMLFGFRDIFINLKSNCLCPENIRQHPAEFDQYRFTSTESLVRNPYQARFSQFSHPTYKIRAFPLISQFHGN